MDTSTAVADATVQGRAARCALRLLLGLAALLVPVAVVWLSAGSAEAADHEQPLPSVLHEVHEVHQAVTHTRDAAPAPVRRTVEHVEHVQHVARPHLDRLVTTTRTVLRHTPLDRVVAPVADPVTEAVVPAIAPRAASHASPATATHH